MTTSQVRMIGIDVDMAGQRVDNFLIKTLKGLPKSRVYRIIRKGEVRVNGKRVKPQVRLHAGDLLRIPPIAHLPERRKAVGSFRDLASLILHEDRQLLVINKPAGMAVHGGSGVQVGVIETLRHALPEGHRLELVHRLDRGTSGCLMVAKRRACLRLLQDALRWPGQVGKDYLAVTHGHWPGALKEINQPLLTTGGAGREKVTRVNPQGKAAGTRFTTLASGADLSVIKASPLTGRTHQIRVHAQWARHPLVGDERYGDDLKDRSLATPVPRLMLHAAKLRIPALDGIGPVTVEAPLDPLMSKFILESFEDNIDNIMENNQL